MSQEINSFNFSKALGLMKQGIPCKRSSMHEPLVVHDGKFMLVDRDGNEFEYLGTIANENVLANDWYKYTTSKMLKQSY